MAGLIAHCRCVWLLLVGCLVGLVVRFGAIAVWLGIGAKGDWVYWGREGNKFVLCHNCDTFVSQ